uniref:Uncharacterized protein n=1 Tax=Eutreptiella gymnastica TaxID=73025 RepID=A0A7S4LHJ2_9EUGL
MENMQGKKLHILRSWGVDVTKVVNGRPQVFGLSMENMKQGTATVAYFAELEVDVVRVVNKHPQVFGYSVEKMKGTVAYLEDLGVNLAKVVNGLPQVFELRMENLVRGRLHILRSWELMWPKQ